VQGKDIEASLGQVFSEQFSKLVRSYFTIAKYLIQQSWPDVFSSMYGNNRGPAIGVSQKIVTSFDTNHLESGML
jgi:hypothetical protein